MEFHFLLDSVFLFFFLLEEMKRQNIKHAFQEPHKINIKHVCMLGVPSPTNLLYVEIMYMYS
jgi:hypothetical protein